MKTFGVILSIFVITLTFLSQTELQVVEQESISVGEALSSSDITGFSRADKVRKFIFPQDDGAHPDFQTEWWYYTGNLQTTNKRLFGFQFTIFRRSITPEATQRKSPWSTNQLYFAHFAVSDIETGNFIHEERFSRGAIGLAGAEQDPIRIWIENWFIEHKDNQSHVFAATDKCKIDLQMKPLKQRILNGNKGLSQKSNEQGNASYYYSQTRLQTTGKIAIGQQVFEVNGLSWCDREWSTSALAKNQSGWDWFSIQLEDGRDIMLYQLRLKDGNIDTNSSGTFVDKDGKYEHLTHRDFSIEVLDHWTSNKSNITYPARWKVSIPEKSITMYIQPLQANQELTSNFSYWEGAVSISGEKISGKGYVEMTGYKSK